MNKVILCVAVIAAISFTSCKNHTKQENQVNQVSKGMATKEIYFGVRGNCGMCKNTIENAANNVDGVTSAIWDVDKKKINVSFDESKTSIESIHKAIAASGYDTQTVAGSEEAYKSLPECCKYDHNMVMNQ